MFKKLFSFIFILGVTISLYGGNGNIYNRLYADLPLNSSIFVDGLNGGNLYQQLDVNLPGGMFIEVQRVGDEEIGKFIGLSFTL